MTPFPRDQVVAVQAVVNSGGNVFVTGGAGTGKSRVLQLIKAYLSQVAITLAVTGLAAIQVGGITLDSFFKRRALADNVKVIIIEEVSLLSKAMLEKLDEVLRSITSCQSTMGGMRVIMFGDFYQLPPLGKHRESIVPLPYAFESRVWTQLSFNVVELACQMRCTDDILASIRMGNETATVIRRLSKLTISHAEAQQLDDHVHLFFSKSDADEYNAARLDKLRGVQHTFTATIADAVKRDFANVPLNLSVKFGARVMCIKNDTYTGEPVANGECGIVVDMVQGKLITVNLDDNRVVRFTTKSWYVDHLGKSIRAVTQVPLTLAWGMTINKAQGLTLHKVVAHLTNDMFPGQAYVAISRVKSLNNLRLVGYRPGKRTINAARITL